MRSLPLSRITSEQLFSWINRKGQSEEVEVQEMSPEDDCGKDMFVEVLYREGKAEDVFSVPLYELEGIDADPKTQEAIA